MEKFCLIFVLLFSHSEAVSAFKSVDPETHTSDTTSQTEVRRLKRFVQLEEGDDGNPSNYQPCNLPDGAKGQCRVPNSCVLKDFGGDFLGYARYLCVYDTASGSIGICCPQAELDDSINGLAGDLPQTALANEDADTLTRITSGVSRTRGCGVSTASRNRLVGARPANPHEWPWMAAVMSDKRGQYCGGALITDRHVVTAAHCMFSNSVKLNPGQIKVRLGEYDFRRSNDTRSYDYRVTEFRLHRDYQQQTYRHDICILKLHKPAIFNTYIWPLCLPPLGRDFVNESLIVIGWGTQFYGGPPSDVLMEVAMPVWSHETCQKAHTNAIYDTVLCAGGYEGGQDSCQGDSGGPLMYQMESGRWALVGIVSWGVRCGEPGRPGMYTNVQKYLRWIVQNTKF